MFNLINFIILIINLMINPLRVSIICFEVCWQARKRNPGLWVHLSKFIVDQQRAQ